MRPSGHEGIDHGLEWETVESGWRLAFATRASVVSLSSSRVLCSVACNFIFSVLALYSVGECPDDGCEV